MPKIFILDDDKLQNDLNVLILKTIGLNDVECCSTGEDAFQYLENCKKNNMFPDLMLVDLNINGITGISFIKHYESKYKKYSPYLKIIVLTNSIFEDERNEALKFESVIDFWSKPFNKNKLLEVLRKINIDNQRSEEI